jgi:hypothetical protein
MVELTIKRPNGKIEEVETKFVGMTKVLFGKIQAANEKAGAGEVLSWVLVDSRTDTEKQQQIIDDSYTKAEFFRNSDPAKCVKLIAKADAEQARLDGGAK